MYVSLTLQDVFQMCSSTLQTHLHPTCRVLDNSDALFPWNRPDFSSNRCLEIRNCLWIVYVHIVLQIALKVKVWRVQVWRVWSPLWVTPPTDEAIRKELPELVQRVV